jgi:hypothetical protein
LCVQVTIEEVMFALENITITITMVLGVAV